MNNLPFTNFEEVQDIEALRNRIREALEIIFDNVFDEDRQYIVDDLISIDIEKIVRMLEWGKD